MSSKETNQITLSSSITATTQDTVSIFTYNTRRAESSAKAVGTILIGTVGWNPRSADKENLVVDEDLSASTFEKVDERLILNADAVTYGSLFTK